jgi:hypothetical protein
MTDEKIPEWENIPEWAREKAQRRHRMGTAIQSLAGMIAKHEQPPVSDDVLIVRAVLAAGMDCEMGREGLLAGYNDDTAMFKRALPAYRSKKAELDAR